MVVCRVEGLWHEVVRDGIPTPGQPVIIRIGGIIQKGVYTLEDVPVGKIWMKQGRLEKYLVELWHEWIPLPRACVLSTFTNFIQNI